ncbi:MAG: PT domain-containing protein [Clostridia bacterium]|nr:PT domain-containing protein [Clostridia bacterium]
MKRLFSMILIFLAVCTLTACFDSDDIFGSEDGTEKNTDKATEAPPTDVPTEKPTDEPTEEPTEPILPPSKEDIFDMIQYGDGEIKNAVNDSDERKFLRSLIGIDARGDGWGQAWEKMLYEFDVPDITTDSGDARVTRAWSYDANHCLSVSYYIDQKRAENIFTNFDREIYVLDGATLDEQLCKDSIYLAIGFHGHGCYPGFRKIVSATMEEGKLTLSICVTKYYSTNDSEAGGCAVIELDKASISGDITEVNIEYCNKNFDFNITRNFDGGKIEETSFWNEKVTACERTFFKARDWSAQVPECEFDYTIEIIEKLIVGNDDKEHYAMPIYEFTGEKRTILYNSELGVCVEGDRSLTLNEEDKALINSFIN